MYVYKTNTLGLLCDCCKVLCVLVGVVFKASRTKADATTGARLVTYKKTT